MMYTWCLHLCVVHAVLSCHVLRGYVLDRPMCVMLHNAYAMRCCVRANVDHVWHGRQCVYMSVNVFTMWSHMCCILLHGVTYAISDFIVWSVGLSAICMHTIMCVYRITNPMYMQLDGCGYTLLQSCMCILINFNVCALCCAWIVTCWLYFTMTSNTYHYITHWVWHDMCVCMPCVCVDWQCIKPCVHHRRVWLVVVVYCV